MIYLHLDQGAGERIARVTGELAGDVLSIDLGEGGDLRPDDVTVWLGQAARPVAVVVTGASAPNRATRRLYESLRRIAKFKGIDVHIAGDRSLETVCDHVVRSDEDLADTAPAGSTAKRVSDLIKAETLTRFEPAEMDIPTVKEAMAAGNLSEDEARRRIAWMKSQKVFVNNLYQVNIEPLPGDMAHLIIRRIDRQPIHNWSHFQQIKNALLGEECEAVEIYPPESRLVDAKHHYHLWGFTRPGRTLGIGFKKRQVAADE